MQKTAKITKEGLTLPSNSWGPLPSDLSLRKYILDITYGAWKKKRVNAVAWQRSLRAKSGKRLRRIHSAMTRPKKK